ncbi:MAG: hypothetical protein M1360_04585 [Candidatus Marsarchaeota archaeon]|jgi:hypothetical protein|nr:hypothetical protein [Candidatus Marsarchaeota archaeon]MCL5419183.1 hypothetical protein [Candidatus Marsarchaeota archaeon]
MPEIRVDKDEVRNQSNDIASIVREVRDYRLDKEKEAEKFIIGYLKNHREIASSFINALAVRIEEINSDKMNYEKELVSIIKQRLPKKEEYTYVNPENQKLLGVLDKYEVLWCFGEAFEGDSSDSILDNEWRKNLKYKYPGEIWANVLFKIAEKLLVEYYNTPSSEE